MEALSAMTVSASRAGLWVLPSYQPQELTIEASGCCPSLLPKSLEPSVGRWPLLVLSWLDV